MIRIVLGYCTTRPLSEDPTVLYCGHSGREAQAAIDHAPADIVRCERIDGPRSYRGKKTKTNIPPKTQSKKTAK